MLNLFEREKLDLINLPAEQTAVCACDLSLWFGDMQALNGINIKIPKNRVTAFIGQSGCGKSTLIGCFNRMNDLQPRVKISGQVVIDGRDVYHKKQNVAQLRSRIGMVFQQPNPFPISIYENVCYGLRLQNINQRRQLDNAVESALTEVALWDEVKDRLFEPATKLSGGQQQRMVIARALALKPEILMLDEPTSALDPLTTLYVEELIHQLKTKCSIIFITHNMQQAARVSDYTAFFHQGQLIEYNDSDTLFTMPRLKQTEDYITGRFG